MTNLFHHESICMWLWLTKTQKKGRGKTEPSSYCSCVPDTYSAGMKLILSLIYTQVWECTLYWPHSLTYHCIQTHTHTPNKINDLMPTWFLKSIPGYKMNLQGLLSTSTIATGCEHRYYLWCEQLKFHHSHSKQWSMDSIIELGPSAVWVARLIWSWLLGGLIPLGHNGTHTHTHCISSLTVNKHAHKNTQHMKP